MGPKLSTGGPAALPQSLIPVLPSRQRTTLGDAAGLLEHSLPMVPGTGSQHVRAGQWEKRIWGRLLKHRQVLPPPQLRVKPGRTKTSWK